LYLISCPLRYKLIFTNSNGFLHTSGSPPKTFEVHKSKGKSIWTNPNEETGKMQIGFYHYESI
jgi:hypothetical protein